MRVAELEGLPDVLDEHLAPRRALWNSATKPADDLRLLVTKVVTVQRPSTSTRASTGRSSSE